MENLPQVMVTLMPFATIALVVALALVFGLYRHRERRRMFEAALAANQPAVAWELIHQRRTSGLATGLVYTGIGLALLLTMIWIPAARAGDRSLVLVIGAVLLGAGVPLAIYSYFRERKEDDRKGAPGSGA